MNLFILDLETSGLLPDKHEILEIGCVNATTGETFEVKVRPLHIKDAQPEALAVNGYNEKDWEESFLLPHALELLSEFVGKEQPYFMAYNASFDLSFLEKAYRDCSLPWPFHYHKLDLLTLAWAWREKQTWDMSPSLSLKNLCTELHITPEPPIHRALAGAQSAYEVYKHLTMENLIHSGEM